MQEIIDSFITSAESLEKAIEDGAPNEDSLMNSHGDLFPDLDKYDLIDLVQHVKAKSGNIDPKKWDQEAEELFEVFEGKFENLKTRTVPNLFNGNGSQACSSFKITIDWINDRLSSYQKSPTDWEEVEGSSAIPKNLAVKLRAIATRIDNLGEKAEGLDEKVETISKAHQAAESLPTDMNELQDATKAIAQSREVVEKNQEKSTKAWNAAEGAVEYIKNLEKEAKELVANVEDAYSAATTLGLGESFATKARNLSYTLVAWVAGLAVALGIAAWQGYNKIEVLQSLIAQDKSASIVWATLITAFLSVAAPVWFAWMATKQIGQRFRLAEDYAYKASVAKAYEGYRREASRLDPAFAHRLFKIALDRLEEAPLRFVEDENHGSPFAEALATRFRKKETARTQEESGQRPSLDSTKPARQDSDADVVKEVDPEDLES